MSSHRPVIVIVVVAAISSVGINMSGMALPPPEPAPTAMEQFASADLSTLAVVALSTFAIGFAVARM